MALQRRKTTKIADYIKMLKQFDYFENRYDFSTESTYLYNPYTGECCHEVSASRVYSEQINPYKYFSHLIVCIISG